LPNCIVCNTPNIRRQPGADFSRFDCDRCGSFALSGSAEVDLPEQLDQVPLLRSLMSYTLRRMQQPDGAHLHIIRTDELPSFWRQDRLPTPQQQADALVSWAGENQPASFEFAEISAPALAALNAVRLQLHALAYNLGNFLRTLATPEPIKDWSLTSLKEKLIKIGAKVVSHGRYVAFQMAEVAIPRQMFQETSSWKHTIFGGGGSFCSALDASRQDSQLLSTATKYGIATGIGKRKFSIIPSVLNKGRGR
jgi:hypothetical protein